MGFTGRLRKPGAFERYRYREDLFPGEVFREAHDRLHRALGERRGDIEYLRLLHLAAQTMESEVEETLKEILGRKEVPRADLVRERVLPREPAPPVLEAPMVDLLAYDELLVAATEDAE